MIWLFCLGWTLRHIDNVCAKTTIRMWHELHVAKKIPHDFQDMIYPSQNSLFMGVVKNKEIRAIAQCRRIKNSMNVSKIAHAPEQLDAGVMLLNLLNERNTLPEWQIIKKQHFWYYEELYLLLDDCKN